MTRSATSGLLLGELGLACACAMAALLTAVWPDWIEVAFGVDPDHHSSETEWLLVTALAAGSVISAALARIEWRRLRAA